MRFVFICAATALYVSLIGWVWPKAAATLSDPVIDEPDDESQSDCWEDCLSQIGGT
jgi:hypothetical protein